MKAASEALERIVGRIQTIGGLRVLPDAVLAVLQGISTRQFNQAVKRNAFKFPTELMFRLTAAEFDALRSQLVTSNAGRGGRRVPPQAFTEHGALMAATILKSPRAVDVSVHVVRAFVHFRDLLAASRELSHRMDEMETRIEAKLADHDLVIADVLSAIRRLINRPTPPRRRIGFESDS
jgi:hypothetical protein